MKPVKQDTSEEDGDGDAGLVAGLEQGDKPDRADDDGGGDRASALPAVQLSVPRTLSWRWWSGGGLFVAGHPVIVAWGREGIDRAF